jgi:hypothetical protein
MLLVAVVLLIAVTVVFTLSIRAQDVPPADPVSPTRHLEERKAAIYENLRDLQFEYRVGKLSDADYQQTKLGLQKELAAVLGEIDKVNGTAVSRSAVKTPAPARAAAAVETKAPTAPAGAPQEPAHVCPHCGASFRQPMKFCGECGKAMQ